MSRSPPLLPSSLSCQELVAAWATEGAKRLVQMAEWKPGMGPAEPTYEPPTLSGKGAGANAAAMAGRLESEIRAAIAMGPPPGMSKRQWERVQAAAKKQLAALDDHPRRLQGSGPEGGACLAPRDCDAVDLASPRAPSARAPNVAQSRCAAIRLERSGRARAQLKERMERVVTSEMKRPQVCSLCGQHPPCPHVAVYTAGKLKSGLAHWVGNQVGPRNQTRIWP